MNISWTNDDIWVTGYKIYQLRVNNLEHYESISDSTFTQTILEDANTSLTEIADITSTTYEHRILRDNGIYAYRVIAYNRDNVVSKD